MRIRNLGRTVSLHMGAMAILCAGCHSAAQPKPSHETDSSAVATADQARLVAEQALGKQAEIVAQGDLAHNGLEQLLVVDRFAKPPGAGDKQADPARTVFVTRAAILEKKNGNWSELLRCDEHLKNPYGYLGGSPAERINGWRLEFSTNTKQGLVLNFTPADNQTGTEGTGMGESGERTVVVRWNTKAQRYQSLDASHEGYLSEAPTLETPHSILR